MGLKPAATAVAASFRMQSYGLLSKFPENFSFAFAYGSGVKKQLGYDDASQQKNMIDMVFCVDQPLQWHADNLRANPTHYSGLGRLCGATAINHYQNGIGAKVYCNTLVPLDNGQMVKYGVISTQSLIDDLQTWRYLYMAGRLHKPVEVLHEPTDNIRAAVDVNFKNAVRASLLLLPESFTFYDLFYCIANLSYGGDFRMIFGEKKDKVRNIVEPQLDEFVDLYRPTLQAFSAEQCLTLPTNETGALWQNRSPIQTLFHLQQLPLILRQNILKANSSMGNSSSVVLERLAKNTKLPNILNEQIRAVVWNSSVAQSLKNILSAGITKSIRYSWKKILKTINL